MLQLGIIEIHDILLAVCLLHREEQGLATPGLRPPSRGTTMYTPSPPDPRDLETLPYWRVTLSLKVNPPSEKRGKYMSIKLTLSVH